MKVNDSRMIDMVMKEKIDHAVDSLYHLANFLEYLGLNSADEVLDQHLEEDYIYVRRVWDIV